MTSVASFKDDTLMYGGHLEMDKLVFVGSNTCFIQTRRPNLLVCES